jgi:hypothetical protein
MQRPVRHRPHALVQEGGIFSLIILSDISPMLLQQPHAIFAATIRCGSTHTEIPTSCQGIDGWSTLRIKAPRQARRPSSPIGMECCEPRPGECFPISATQAEIQIARPGAKILFREWRRDQIDISTQQRRARTEIPDVAARSRSERPSKLRRVV